MTDYELAQERRNAVNDFGTMIRRYEDSFRQMRDERDRLRTRCTALERAIRSSHDVDDGLINCFACVHYERDCKGLGCDPHDKAELWEFDEMMFSVET